MLANPISLQELPTFEFEKIERLEEYIICEGKGDCEYQKLFVEYSGSVYLMDADDFFHDLQCYNYLRSKGYALPTDGYSVAELIAAGVFVIKKEDNNG